MKFSENIELRVCLKRFAPEQHYAGKIAWTTARISFSFQTLRPEAKRQTFHELNQT